jgi:hypothetical protein
MNALAAEETQTGMITQTRRDFSRRLTGMLEENRDFCFLRLGDGELAFLLRWQEDAEHAGDPDYLRPSCEVAFGSPGLNPEHGERLLRSLENASCVDTYLHVEYNRESLPGLHWQPPAGEFGVLPREASALLGDWLFLELRDYLTRHRCIICGAEGRLLEELLQVPAYREIVRDFIPENARLDFVQPRRDGARLSEDLDLIKDDLRAAIKATGADTLLLSLGGAAKIIGCELARELQVRVLDIGSLLRGLTYAGSDGQASWRASHHPFVVRVPFEMYMQALRRAFPDMPPEVRLAKAHAQLCLDLQRKEFLTSITSDANDASVFDPTGENLAHFQANLRAYHRTHFLPALVRAETRKLAAEFVWWRMKKGVGLEGRVFHFLLQIKRGLSRLLPRARPASPAH